MENNLSGPSSSQVQNPAPIYVIVVASSAGGLDALRVLMADLPSNLPAAVLVVQHLERTRPSMMAKILQRTSSLPVEQAKHNQRLRPGRVLIAPPDHHLLVIDESVSLTQTAPVHFVRPSADLLFESAAETYGSRTIAVVLTGTGHDGSRGVIAVKNAGGTVIVQDHATSKFYGMPGSAVQTGKVDLILPLEQIAEKLLSLVEKGME
jgi:two-component system, chemotaxis family, protein-glutamate methylesterase/glutaminase